MFTRLLINGSVKVAPRGVSIALALPALVRVLAHSRTPRQIVEEGAAFLTALSLGIVHALAPAVHL